MHAIERLRYIARAGDEDGADLACEAAAALAGLSSDRRALVLSCQRLVEHHPRCAPLWWVCAHALEAFDLRSTMVRLIRELEEDPTVDELFALPETGQTVVAEATRTIVRALCDRLDLHVRLVGAPNALRASMRYFHDFRVPPQAVLDVEAAKALDGADFVVFEPYASSATGLLVRASAKVLADPLRGPTTPRYAVAGVGRVLPERLFLSMVARLKTRGREVFPLRRDDASFAGLSPDASERTGRVELLDDLAIFPSDSLNGVVTGRGCKPARVVFHPNPGVSHIDCPSPTELLLRSALG